MKKLAVIEDYVNNGYLPAIVLTKWLEIIVPNLRWDSDPVLLNKYDEIDELFDKYAWSVFDTLPLYLQRRVEDEKDILARIPDVADKVANLAHNALLGIGNQKKTEANSPLHGSERQHIYELYDNIITHGSPYRFKQWTSGSEAPKGHKQMLQQRESADNVKKYLKHVHKLASVKIMRRRRDQDGGTYAVVEPFKKRAHIKNLNQLYSYIGVMNQRRSQISVAEAVWMIVKESNRNGTGLPLKYTWCGERITGLRLVNKVLRCFNIGANAAMITGALVACAGLPAQTELWQTLYDMRCYEINCEGLVKLTKMLTMMYRRTRRDVAGDKMTVESMMCATYTTLLAGRAVTPVDYEAELAQRATEIPHYIPVYGKHFGDVADQDVERFYELAHAQMMTLWNCLMRDAMGTKTIHEAAEKRIDWSTHGSSDASKLLIDGEKVVRMTKNLAVEQLQKEDIRRTLDRKPIEVSKCSEKGELGGLRLILAPQDNHYFICTYATEGIENNLWRAEGFEKGLTGLDVLNMESTKVALLAGARTYVSSMTDYVDFNAQHDARTESLLYETQAETAQMLDKQPEYVKAVRWHAESHKNRWIVTPDGVRHTAPQGLHSGTRATDIGNSLCNQLYIRTYAADLLRQMPWLAEHVRKQFPVVTDDTHMVRRVHQGDDAAVFGNQLLVFLLHQHMVNAGLKFNDFKQLCGPYGEYLRKFYFADGVAGFPVRSLGALLVKKFESSELHDPAEDITSLTTTISLMVRRGFDVHFGQVMWYHLVDKFRKVRASHWDKQPVNIPMSTVTKSKRLGGLGCAAPGLSTDDGRPTHGRPPTFELRGRLPKLESKGYATKDWLDSVSRKLGGIPWNRMAVESDCHNQLTRSAMGPKHLEKQLTLHKQEMAKWVDSERYFNTKRKRSAVTAHKACKCLMFDLRPNSSPTVDAECVRSRQVDPRSALETYLSRDVMVPGWYVVPSRLVILDYIEMQRPYKDRTVGWLNEKNRRSSTGAGQRYKEVTRECRSRYGMTHDEAEVVGRVMTDADLYFLHKESGCFTADVKVATHQLPDITAAVGIIIRRNKDVMYWLERTLKSCIVRPEAVRLLRPVVNTTADWSHWDAIAAQVFPTGKVRAVLRAWFETKKLLYCMAAVTCTLLRWCSLPPKRVCDDGWCNRMWAEASTRLRKAMLSGEAVHFEFPQVMAAITEAYRHDKDVRAHAVPDNIRHNEDWMTDQRPGRAWKSIISYDIKAKKGLNPSTITDCFQHAVSASPFRSVQTTQRALGLGKAEAVKWCIRHTVVNDEDKERLATVVKYANATGANELLFAAADAEFQLPTSLLVHFTDSVMAETAARSLTLFENTCAFNHTVPCCSFRTLTTWTTIRSLLGIACDGKVLELLRN
jgi:hypothetical protein